MANIATITSVNLPAHLYPNIETRINDNSVRRYTTDRSGNYKFLAVSLTPKGEDGKIITVDRGIDEYDELFGHGPCSVYGQAHLNARAAASTGIVTLQVLRLTADDATYANAHVYVCFKPNDDQSSSDIESGISVKFVVKHADMLTDLKNLAGSAPSVESLVADDPSLAGWTVMRFISIAYKGRGACGNNYSFRITNHKRADNSSNFKNYFFEVFEGTRLVESRRVSIYPEALIGSTSLYIPNVVNAYGGSEGSNLVDIDVNDAVLEQVYSAYCESFPPQTDASGNTVPVVVIPMRSFDPILGIDKSLTKKNTVTSDSGQVNMVGYDIAVDGAHFDDPFGIKLIGGDDGAFKLSNADRDAAIEKRFIDAFTGKIDRHILSKYRCPLDYACDAGFSGEVKKALASLVTSEPGIGRSQDFRIYFDLGTDLVHSTDVYDLSQEYDEYIDTWTTSIDGYIGKIKDPYNKKVITVTSTYHLAQALPKHWYGYGGYHIPYANSKYGVIDSFLPNTVFPVFDDSIDQKLLDKLVDAHVNYAAIDPKGNVMRATQTTRYSGSGADNQFEHTEDYIVSNLSEENNALIALAIKKDVEKLICTYLYNFNEASDINTFNRDISNLTGKYAAAQVHSISARFDRTVEEAELGVLHLYIAIQNKPLIKYLQVDIDVNRLEA